MRGFKQNATDSKTLPTPPPCTPSSLCYCTSFPSSLHTVKDFFLHPLRLHDIVQQALRGYPSLLFIALCLFSQLVFYGTFGVELLQVEKWINPSLNVQRKGESKIRVGREIYISNIIDISSALLFRAACAIQFE